MGTPKRMTGKKRKELSELDYFIVGEREAAAFLGLHWERLQYWRLHNPELGPPSFNVGGPKRPMIKYRIGSLKEWVLKQEGIEKSLAS